MSNYLGRDPRGYLGALPLPPVEARGWLPADVAELVGAAERAAAEHGDWSARLGNARRAVGQAQQLDTAALAQAMRDGKRDPGPVNVEAARQAVADAERHVGAAEINVFAARRRLLDALARPDVLASIRTAERQGRAERLRLVEAAAQGEADAALLSSLGRWVEALAQGSKVGPVRATVEGPTGELFARLRQALSDPADAVDLVDVPADEPVSA